LILALHELGDHAEVQAALSNLTDAEQRGSMVDGFSRYEVPPHWLAEQLVRADDLVLRRAASHALALYRPGPQRELAENWLQAQGAASLNAIDDAGLRSGVLALSRAWSLPPPQWTAKVTAHELLTSENQRMVILTPPAVQWMGSPANEPGRDVNNEIRYPVKLKHKYAISTHEVTVQEYLHYRADANIQEDYSPTPDCPMVDITWFHAARYCRWLSEKEGIPESEMCYPQIEAIQPGLTLDSNWLDRTGYRLLTEAEWEFAAHGGYAEGRHFGFAPELLDHYAWTAQNSGYRCHPVGTRLPNDHGLFDMFGNAMEWCQTRNVDHPWPSSGVEPDQGNFSQQIGALVRMESRGAAQLYQPLDARASHRNDHEANASRVYLSFRIARTIRE
jgi:formylglycine-generating enzyme required for sulfatase activity